MTTDEEYEAAIKVAEKQLREAQTADEIRAVWKTYGTVLGHRTLGRMLTGMSSERILTRREERSSRE